MTKKRSDSRSLIGWLGILFLVAGLILVTGFSLSVDRSPRQEDLSVAATIAGPKTPSPTLIATKVPDSLVPTRTPSPAVPSPETDTADPQATPKTTGVESPTVEATPDPVSSPIEKTRPGPKSTEVPSLAMVPSDERYRLGVSIPSGATRDYGLSELDVGWVMDWAVRAQPVLPPNVEYAQTVRMGQGILRPDVATLTAVASARPGSLWLISNEPDVRWQDNVIPEVYARLYHDAYQAIKHGDPSAIVAAGGIAQTSPLRLEYLDLALQSYQEQFDEPLPAQAWQIHTYMLREERDSWGVDIPPGLSDETGKLYTIEDSGDLDLFRQQIYSFREWMASRGYRGLPLIVSEFGILMPSDYGFPPERVAHFLEETWHFFLTASDPALGDPSDGGRLVQRWCWFSLGAQEYPNGALIDPNTGEWSPLAHTWFRLVGE